MCRGRCRGRWRFRTVLLGGVFILGVGFGFGLGGFFRARLGFSGFVCRSQRRALQTRLCSRRRTFFALALRLHRGGVERQRALGVRVRALLLCRRATSSAKAIIRLLKLVIVHHAVASISPLQVLRNASEILPVRVELFVKDFLLRRGPRFDFILQTHRAHRVFDEAVATVKHRAATIFAVENHIWNANHVPKFLLAL